MSDFARRVAYLGVGVIVPLVVIVFAYAAWVGIANLTGVAQTDGMRSGLGVRAAVQIIRDDRGVPHVRANSVRDAMFGEGYAIGSDRLFQIDLTRRYVLGRLSEFFGGNAIEADRHARIFDAGAAVDAQWQSLSADERDLLQAFADGVNAAATHEPLPPEYRAMFAGFDPWTPKDALVVGLATALELTDGWDNVIARDTVLTATGPAGVAALFSLTDPAYDVPTVGGQPVALTPLPPLAAPHAVPPLAFVPHSSSDALGSNAWAIGAERTADGRALLANDPHLARSIPGVWYLVDIAAPGFHVAGATLAGVPGVLLGHNEHLAWGATNGDTAAVTVTAEHFRSADATTYQLGSASREASVRTETIHVRFAKDVQQRYFATVHGFVVETTGEHRHAVTLAALSTGHSPLSAFLALDRAGSVSDGLAALSTYAGPTENFVLADTTGRVAYTLAGTIPVGANWGLSVADALPASHGATTSSDATLSFSVLPHVAPSRNAEVVTANNLPFGAGYPYRLAAWFTAPYRAAEIRRRLQATHTVDVATSAAIQTDTTSLAEAELARLTVAAVRRAHLEADPDLGPAVVALAGFDGRFEPDSKGATVAQRLRLIATYDLIASHLPTAAANAYFANGPAFVTLLRALRERPKGWFARDDVDGFLVTALRDTVTRFGRDRLVVPYGEAYAVQAAHPLSAFGATFWNGPRVEGRGGGYAPAVQEYRLGQSFRAVWDVGNWEAGGISLPLGESGEPGSPHYRDGAVTWSASQPVALPFADAAVEHARRAVLTLQP